MHEFLFSTSKQPNFFPSKVFFSNMIKDTVCKHFESDVALPNHGSITRAMSKVNSTSLERQYSLSELSKLRICWNYMWECARLVLSPFCHPRMQDLVGIKEFAQI